MRHLFASAVAGTWVLTGCQSLPDANPPRFVIALVGEEEAAKAGGFDFDPAAFRLVFVSPRVVGANVGGGCVLAGPRLHEAVVTFREAGGAVIATSPDRREPVMLMVSESRYIGAQPSEAHVASTGQALRIDPVPQEWRGDLALSHVYFEGDDGDSDSPMGAEAKTGFSFAFTGESQFLGLFRLEADREGVTLAPLGTPPDVTVRAGKILGRNARELAPPVMGMRNWIDCRP